MSGKLMGAALILLGSVGLCLGRSRERRREAELLQALSAVLERMETAIRWQKCPLPELMAQAAGERLCGELFRQVAEGLKRGEALQNLWQDAGALLPGAAAGILRTITWEGDEEHLTGELRRTSAALRRVREEQLAAERQQAALHRGLVLGGAALVVILLL